MGVISYLVDYGRKQALRLGKVYWLEDVEDDLGFEHIAPVYRETALEDGEPPESYEWLCRLGAWYSRREWRAAYLTTDWADLPWDYDAPGWEEWTVEDIDEIDMFDDTEEAPPIVETVLTPTAREWEGWP